MLKSLLGQIRDLVLEFHICWMISYFCFKSIWAFFASFFFLCANICLIWEALIFRFRSAPESLNWREGLLRLEPLLLDVGESGIDTFVWLPLLEGRVVCMASVDSICDRLTLFGVELREELAPFSYKHKYIRNIFDCVGVKKQSIFGLFLQ